MAAIFSITNQKGGVAKTTTAIHLARGIAKKFTSSRVLFIDLDSQRNASSVLLKKNTFTADESALALFQGKKEFSPMIHDSDLVNLKVIPASLQLVEVESLLASAIDGFFRLKDALDRLGSEFEYIIIDCPPSLSVTTVNALVAASYVIVPIQISKFSLDGIQGILDTVNSVSKRYNPQIKILGGLLTFLNERTNLSQAMIPEVSRLMPLFTSSIPRSVSVEEAHLLKSDLFDYAPKSKVAQSYQNFVDEVIAKIR